MLGNLIVLYVFALFAFIIWLIYFTVNFVSSRYLMLFVYGIVALLVLKTIFVIRSLINYRKVSPFILRQLQGIDSDADAAIEYYGNSVRCALSAFAGQGYELSRIDVNTLVAAMNQLMDRHYLLRYENKSTDGLSLDCFGSSYPDSGYKQIYQAIGRYGVEEAPTCYKVSFNIVGNVGGNMTVKITLAADDIFTRFKGLPGILRDSDRNHIEKETTVSLF